MAENSINSVVNMSDDALAREDQAIIDQLSQRAMHQIAAGRSAEEVSRDLRTTGLAQSTCEGLVEHLQQRWQAIAAAPQANAEVYFRTKYPEMRPVRNAPWLFNVHGIGAGLYTERDRDPATGTVVKTHCLSLCFVPLIALGAYRVVSHGTSWTLIGRVPLSRFAKWWNVAFFLSVAAWIGFCIWDDRENSPSAAAARRLAEADKASAAGSLVAASLLYAEVARGHTEHAHVARQRCIMLVDRAEMDHMPMHEVREVFQEVLQLRVSHAQLQAVRQRGLEIVKRRTKDDPRGAIALLNELAVPWRND